MTASSPRADTNPVNPHMTLLKERLAALKAIELTLHDESHLVAQHRLVYDLLRDLIPYPIHALALTTRAPSKGNP